MCPIDFGHKYKIIRFLLTGLNIVIDYECYWLKCISKMKLSLFTFVFNSWLSTRTNRFCMLRETIFHVSSETSCIHFCVVTRWPVLLAVTYFSYLCCIVPGVTQDHNGTRVKVWNTVTSCMNDIALLKKMLLCHLHGSGVTLLVIQCNPGYKIAKKNGHFCICVKVKYEWRHSFLQN